MPGTLVRSSPLPIAAGADDDDNDTAAGVVIMEMNHMTHSTLT